jgi:hypothetical protein
VKADISNMQTDIMHSLREKNAMHLEQMKEKNNYLGAPTNGQRTESASYTTQITNKPFTGLNKENKNYNISSLLTKQNPSLRVASQNKTKIQICLKVHPELENTLRFYMKPTRTSWSRLRCIETKFGSPCRDVIFAQVHPSDDRTEVTLDKSYQYQAG